MRGRPPPPSPVPRGRENPPTIRPGTHDGPPSMPAPQPYRKWTTSGESATPHREPAAAAPRNPSGTSDRPRSTKAPDRDTPRQDQTRSTTPRSGSREPSVLRGRMPDAPPQPSAAAGSARRRRLRVSGPPATPDARPADPPAGGPGPRACRSRAEVQPARVAPGKSGSTQSLRNRHRGIDQPAHSYVKLSEPLVLCLPAFISEINLLQ